MERRRVDPLGSSGSATISDPDIDTHVMYSSDEEDGGISFTTTETKCERLFEEGLELKVCGEIDRALPCFLDCLKGMQECQYFAKLPQTLHHLGELYNTIGNLDIALEFVQAEKLFYEAILVSSAEGKTRESSSRSKRRPFGKKRSSKSGSNPAEYGDLLLKKANEYEMLAKMCAKERKFGMAVNYSGKAAKLKRSVYGPDHPETIASLENFSLFYAERGRVEYAATLEKVHRTQPPEITSGHVTTEPRATTTCTAETLGQEVQDIAVGTPECQQALANLQPSMVASPVQSLQEAETLLHTSECKHTTPTEQGSWSNESASVSNGQQNIDLVTMLQPCTTVTHTSNSTLSDEIHWPSDADNVIHNKEECLEVCIHKPELNIEHTRFCPLWVLLLGAFLEMALVAYMVYVR